MQLIRRTVPTGYAPLTEHAAANICVAAQPSSMPAGRPCFGRRQRLVGCLPECQSCQRLTKRVVKILAKGASTSDMARAPVDSGARLVFRQMVAILKKNALLKYADWRQTLAEVRRCLPCSARMYIVARAFKQQSSPLPPSCFLQVMNANQRIFDNMFGVCRGTGTADLAESWLHSICKVFVGRWRCGTMQCLLGWLGVESLAGP